MSDPDPNSPDDAEAFVTDLPVTKLFGTHPKSAVIGVLLSESEDPTTAFSVNEITRIAGLDETTVERTVRELVEYDVVVETDELEEPTYRLDETTDIADDLRRLNDDLSEHVF